MRNGGTCWPTNRARRRPRRTTRLLPSFLRDSAHAATTGTPGHSAALEPAEDGNRAGRGGEGLDANRTCRQRSPECEDALGSGRVVDADLGERLLSAGVFLAPGKALSVEEEAHRRRVRRQDRLGRDEEVHGPGDGYGRGAGVRGRGTRH